MPWERPTLRQLFDRISQDLSGRLLDGDPVRQHSVVAVLAKVWAGACHLMHGMLAWLYQQVFVDTAEGPYLERWARVWGVFRKTPARAAGPVIFTGADGAAVPAGTLLQHQATGLQYAVGEDGEVSGGAATVTARAVAAGAASNLPAGAPLALVSPIAGVRPDGLAGPAWSPACAGPRAADRSRTTRPGRWRFRASPAPGATPWGSASAR
jgi:uncharacterized phage protein gp47/JayE